MNLKEYISSGILESYVLGAASPQEQQEVECMSHIYPEIAEELEKLRSSIEVMATEMAQTPPADSLDFIMEAIENEPQQQPESSEPKIEESKEEAIVVTLPPSESAGVPGGWRNVALAACVVGLIGMGMWVFSSRSTLKQSNETLLALQAELNEANEAQTQLRTSLNDQRLELTLQETQLSVLKAKETRRVTLAGTDNAPDAKAEIFWNPTLEMAFIESTALPIPPTDKQYQLWAIVDGAPVDMGVFELDPSNPDLQRMADVANAQAFAITVEPRGGSESPSLETMVVIGNV